jgi:hypothetical protein
MKPASEARMYPARDLDGTRDNRDHGNRCRRQARRYAMRTLTGTVDSLLGSARRLVGKSASSDTQREAFSQEFGQHPPYKEATQAQRDQFVRETVTPVLSQRAQAVQQASEAGAKRFDSNAATQVQSEANDTFVKAYKVAVDMGLAEKGRTYRDYLDA